MPHRPSVVEPGVLQLAEHAAETVRDLNHLTRGQHAFAEPAELARLLAELTTMASGLPQLLGQLDRWLRHEHHAGRVRADSDTDPDHILSRAAAQLTCGRHAAHDLAAALDTAHQHLAQLAR